MLDGRILVQGSVASLIQKTFGTAKELVVSLDSPADSTGKAILQSFRLRPTRDSRLWSGPLIGGYEALGQIEQQLEQSGLHAAEIRLRDPGLNGVFLQLAGEEAEA
jgi:hypothetical protein